MLSVAYTSKKMIKSSLVSALLLYFYYCKTNSEVEDLESGIILDVGNGYVKMQKHLKLIHGKLV